MSEICFFCVTRNSVIECKLCESKFCAECNEGNDDDYIEWGKNKFFSAECHKCKMHGCILCIETCYTCISTGEASESACGKHSTLRLAECTKDHVWLLCNKCHINKAKCGFCD